MEHEILDLQTPIKTPVLFMVFNRPSKTKQIWNVIKSAKPRKLYVAMDHPRAGMTEDEVKCAEVKKIVEGVDWPCEVKYLYHPVNRGCSLAGKMAWEWLFSQEEEMIFLEDDGLIDKSFFWFAQALLNKYRNDDRIGYIGATNYGLKYGEGSYFFSRMPAATYAMATWKRVLDKYEYKMGSYSSIRKSSTFKKSFSCLLARLILTYHFDDYVRYGGNTYDCQMLYLVHKYNMLNIAPNINMAANIGMDQGANARAGSNSEAAQKAARRKRYSITEIVHPDKVMVSNSFEKKYFRVRFGVKGTGLLVLLTLLKARIHKIIKRR